MSAGAADHLCDDDQRGALGRPSGGRSRRCGVRRRGIAMQVQDDVRGLAAVIVGSQEFSVCS